MSRAANAALILIGGMVGTSLRAGLEAAAPAAPGAWPWTTFWINIAGSALLGVLLEWLAGGEDVGWRRSVRLGVGTGVLGGFTTYSTFSVETVGLLAGGQWVFGLAYALGSAVLGIGVATAAIALLRRVRAVRTR
ncbi:MAG: CrcB family protein [Propionibacteriales bacterium]|nr:CrcB family protein [Propionibacteriales bacterium]